MQKLNKIFTCQKCDAQFPKWQGRCTECGAWGTISEEAAATSPVKPLSAVKPVAAGQILNFNEIEKLDTGRQLTGWGILDQILGPAGHAGLTKESLILISGDPGIGKSTLVLQIAGLLGKQNKKVLYISGEESAQQIKGRADRLNLNLNNLSFLGETDIDIVCSTIANAKPDLAIVDSAQTMACGELPSAAGSLNQVRAVAAKLLETAKQSKTIIILVGHVTKEGQVAGPKTLEHLVDVALSFEGDAQHAYRLLRVTKNRFGPTNELAVFDMQQQGLVAIDNPAEMFLTKRHEPLAGSAITATVDGNRVFLLEIQALVTQTAFGYPQRKTSGYDLTRLNMLIAVLAKRAGLYLDKRDIHLNIAGGFKTKEPAIDLAAALAVISAYYNHSLPTDTVILGEIGLGGEIRPVSHLPLRLKEIKRLGFKKAIVPANEKLPEEYQALVLPVSNLTEAIKILIKE